MPTSSTGRSRIARGAGAALAALVACATPPPVSVATPTGVVRADDLATALWVARALERAALRLGRLSPELPTPQVEVWVVDDPGNGVEGVSGTATRSPWTSRWTLRVEADGSNVGHELFHARFDARLGAWPQALVEGLADRFGLDDDILGESRRTDRLLAVARVTVPALTLEFERRDGTYEGLCHSMASTCTAGPVPLGLERIGALTADELTALTYSERLYFYGVGYAAAMRWLGSEDVHVLPQDEPLWSELLPATTDELAREAAAALGPAALQRWALGRSAVHLASILRDSPRPLTSIDDCLESMDFRLAVGDAPARPLDDDPDFRELLECLWPWIADADRLGANAADLEETAGER